MRITYVGHATVIVESPRLKFVTDPWLTKRPGRLGPKRRVPLDLEKDALDDVGLVTISHGHFDHLDKRSLCMLDDAAPVICHPRLAGIVRRACGRQPVTLDWWEATEVRGVRVTAVPAHHFAARPPFQWKRDYQGYVIESDLTVYHAGDCGMSEHFEEIGSKFDIDIAMLPIGAYHPPSFRKHHLAPEDALDAIETLGARWFVPIHWGTVNLSREPFDEPPKRLMEHARRRNLEGRVRLLRPGDTTDID